MAARDNAAFARVLGQALPRLRRRAIALTGGHLALADDLVQDCLERAWRARERVLRAEAPFPFLSAILRNASIDWHRRNKNEPQPMEIDALAQTLAVVPIEQHARTMDLIKALQTVSPDHRSILLLAGVEGLSYREIAVELDIPIGTVMSRLARARQLMRARLDGGEPDCDVLEPDARSLR